MKANLDENKISRELREARAVSKHAAKTLEKLKQRDKELRLIIRNILEKNSFGEISQSTFTDLYGGYNAEFEAVSARIKALEEIENADGNDKLNDEKLAEACVNIPPPKN